MSLQTSLLFDLRAPEWGTPAPELYAAALEMAAFADEMGVDRINLMEHHGADDGYLPAPFVMGGGVAARTKRCRISLGAIILPLHDPVKIAEQIAVLDIISNGRLDVTLAAGYVEFEFATFGVSLRDRGRLMDQGLETIVRALRGERFDAANGRPVFVRPLPVQKPEDILLVGGGVEASARRAARYGLGFSPLTPALFPLYDEECRRNGFQPGRKYGSGGGPLNIHLARDPEKGWEQIKRHAVHMVTEYAKWAAAEPGTKSPFAGLDNEEALKRAGLFAVWTPEELLQRAPHIVGQYGGLGFMPLIGGLDPKVGWESLELLKSVMPQLKAMERPAAA